MKALAASYCQDDLRGHLTWGAISFVFLCTMFHLSIQLHNWQHGLTALGMCP